MEVKNMVWYVQGNHDPGVGKIQKICNQYGCTGCNGKPLVIDNTFGPQTKCAVKKFQNKLKVSVDGKWGPQTQGAYEKLISKSSSPTTTTSTTKTTIKTSSPLPDDVKQYLVATKNCQSTHPTIMGLSKAIVGNSTTALEKATRISNFIRDRLDYPTGKNYYNNTKYGALTVLTKYPLSNCCDMAHATVALARSQGIPARYRHVDGKFKSGNYGHVLAQLYVDGAWEDSDGTYNSNSLGVIKNWTLIKNKGFYKELPF